MMALQDAGRLTPFATMMGSAMATELHIIVENGVNLPAVCKAIIDRLRYDVIRITGGTVRSVHVCVDSMIL